MKIGDVVEIICEGSNDPKSPHNLTGYSGVVIDINDDYEFPVLVNIEIENGTLPYGFMRCELEVIE